MSHASGMKGRCASAGRWTGCWSRVVRLPSAMSSVKQVVISAVGNSRSKIREAAEGTVRDLRQVDSFGFGRSCQKKARAGLDKGLLVSISSMTSPVQDDAPLLSIHWGHLNQAPWHSD